MGLALGTLRIVNDVSGGVLDPILPKLRLPTLVDIISSSINTHDITKDKPIIQCNLAKSMGKLREDLAEMDDTMKIMIGSTEQLMNRQGHRSWENILSCMMQNPCVEAMDEENIPRCDYLVKEDEQWFHCGTSVDQSKLREVEQWIKRLISDDDVIADLSFDPKVYATIVATTGARCANFAQVFVSSEYQEKHVIDIGTLRYPDIDHPYYKLYRVELKAWRGCNRELFHETNKNGIKGEFQCHKFKPREQYIKDMKSSTRAKAMAVVDGLFD